MEALQSIPAETGENAGTPSPPASILVIDDDAAVCQALSTMLQADGHAVVSATSGKEAVELSRRKHFDLAITDLVMPEMDGTQTLAALKGVDPAMEVMVLTGHGEMDSAVEALQQGACNYLQKPLSPAQLRSAVAAALEKQQRSQPHPFSPAPVGLAREHDLLCALMDSTPDYVYFKDCQSRFLRTNRAHAKALGLSDAGQAVGKTDFDFFPEEDAKSYFRDERQVIETGQPLIGRVEKVRLSDGQARWCSTTKAPIRDAQGRITGLVGITRDVTERQRAEIELAERHRLTSLMVEVGAALTGAASLRQGLQQCTEILVRRIDAAFARVWTVNEAERVLELQASAGMYTHINGGHARVPMGQFRIGRIAESGEPHVTNTVLEDSWVGDPEWARREGMVAFAGYPLKVGERVLGVVAGFARQPLTAAALEAFASVAHNLAQFIERMGAEEALQESEQRYRVLFSQMLMGFALLEVISDENGIPIDHRYLELNTAFEAHTGLRRDKVLGKTIREVLPDIEPFWIETYGKVGTTGESVHFEGYAQPLQKWFEVTAFRLLPGQVAVTFADITQRKRAEEELRLTHFSVEHASDSIFWINPQGRIVYVNEAACRSLGRSREELLSLSIPDIDPNFPPEAWGSIWSKLKALGSLTLETHHQTKEGGVFPVEITSNYLQFGGKEYSFAFARDITERERAEADLLRYAEDLELAKAAQEEHSAKLARLVEELAHERDLLDTLMDNVPDAIYFKDPQCRFTRINASQARVLGVADSRHALGKTDCDFFPQEDAQAYYAVERKIVESGEPSIGNLERVTDASGKLHWVSNTEVPVKDAQGRVTGIVGIARDVTEWKSTLEAFRESEGRYRELFENASDLIYTTDLEARITSLNHIGQQLLGYELEEARQMDIWQLVDPKDWDQFKQGRQRLLAGESGVHQEVELKAKDGRRVRLEVKPRLIYKDGKPVGVQGIGRDITGRDVVEVELRHAQKLESVGRLASGIAHEINTPIQFVGDNTRFLQDSFGSLQALLNKYREFLSTAASGTLPSGFLDGVRRAEEESDSAYLLEEIPKALTQTLEGVTRVATIVRAMKEFAHPESKEMAAADLNKALLSTLTVARNELKYVSDVETDLGDLPLVVCNVGDLNQVFLNLLVNAAHAIGDVVKGTGAKGKIRVRTVAEGKAVLITISDTGGGIPEAIRTRIYDPFFTTKEVGRGTGQGLAIARSVVVERHKGSLTFESEVGKGTTFFVRLPLNPGE
jgi:PAS domain S-box-containing protein